MRRSLIPLRILLVASCIVGTSLSVLVGDAIASPTAAIQTEIGKPLAIQALSKANPGSAKIVEVRDFQDGFAGKNNFSGSNENFKFESGANNLTIKTKGTYFVKFEYTKGDPPKPD